MTALGILLAVLASLGACSATPSAGTSLLRDASPPAAARAPQMAVRRARYVRVDPAAVRQPSTRLDLFPGGAPGAVTVVWTEVQSPSPQTRAWTGRVQEIADSTVTLVVNDTERIVTGTLRLGGALYRLRYAGDGVHVVEELDPRGFPRD